jgi:glycosyltransferase involved in cell wall biosynthesis
MSEDKTEPLFTVVIPLHNMAASVLAAIESALDQAGPRCEVIVVDDGSTDLREEAFATVRTRIRLLTRPNGGPSAARIARAAHAKGRWLVFLDADDVLMPGCLENHRAALATDPCADVSIASHDTLTIDGRTLRTDVSAKLRSGSFCCPDGPVVLDEFRLDSVKGVHIGSVCFHRDLVDRIGGFDEALHCWEILDFMIRALLAAKLTVASSPSVLLVREAANSQFTRTRRSAAYLARISSNLLDHLPRIPAGERDEFCRQIAGFIYQLWKVGAITEFQALARRARHHEALQRMPALPGRLALLPAPLLRATWAIRRGRNRSNR